MDTLVHLCGLIGTNTDVKDVILVIDGLGIHLGVTAVIRTAARTAESAYPTKQLRMIQTDGI